MTIIVLGGGAAGLVAAIKAKTEYNEVIILEKNSKCGKKLLQTGNGRCNFWNSDQDISHYHATDSDILATILKNNQDKVLPFFASLGIVPKVINGYYYPYANQATSITNALVTRSEALGIKINLNENVLKINYAQDFTITTNIKTYHADKVIMALGSMAAPKTGSTGYGYQLAQDLGHSLIPVLPALVQLYGDKNYYADWAGVRCDAALTLIEDGQEIKTEVGEVQLTNYGLSGICTFNLSSWVAKGLAQNREEVIKINFVPWFKGDKKAFKAFLDEQAATTNFALKQILEGFLNYKIVNLIFRLLRLPMDKRWNEEEAEPIIDLIMSFPFQAIKTNSFAEAQVCSGGIPLREINPSTMESLIVPNLYLVGEILDVDGDCGGYNLGFAWISALAAGEACHD